jgi:hypothetical protein
MHRPSLYVLLCIAACVGSYALVGDTLQQQARVSKSREPKRVRADRPPRASKPTSLRGRVFDGLGFLVTGAEVAALDGSAPSVRSGADGCFAIDLPGAGPFDLRVRNDGFRTQLLRLPAAGDPAIVRLEPSAPWDSPLPAPLPPPSLLTGEGFVRDEAGKPVAHARIAVAETGATAHADDVGRYRIDMPVAGATLVASAEGSDDRGLCARSDLVVLPKAQGLQPLPDLVLRTAAAIRGTVRDGKGQPITGVPLQLSGDGCVRTVESGADGVFHIAGLSAGRYELTPAAWRGCLGGNQVVELNQPIVDCDLRLSASAPRRLRVVDEQGSPLLQAIVAVAFAGVRASVARADADGFVALPEAPAVEGTFEVRDGTGLSVRRLLRRGPAGELIVAAP